MNLTNFFFTTQWSQALGGLSGIASSLQAIAYSILAATFLMGVYEAFLSGGSLQKFASTVLKFGVAAAVISNWSAFFNDVVGTGTTIATTILGGAGDIIKQWATDLGTYMSGDNLSSLSANGLSGLATSIVFIGIVMVSAMVFFGCLKILTLFFIFWGGVLYCMGPLMIALSPSGLVGSYAGQYCRSLAEWALWPALYAMFAALMVALNASSVSAVMSQNNSTLAGTTDQATSNALQLGLTSLVYGLCMILVPFIAHFLVRGDFTGAAVGAMRVARQAASLASGGGASMITGPIGIGSAGGGGGTSVLPISGGGSGSIGAAPTAFSSPSVPPPPTPPSSTTPPATAGAY